MQRTEDGIGPLELLEFEVLDKGVATAKWQGEGRAGCPR